MQGPTSALVRALGAWRRPPEMARAPTTETMIEDWMTLFFPPPSKNLYPSYRVGVRTSVPGILNSAPARSRAVHNPSRTYPNRPRTVPKRRVKRRWSGINNP